MSKDERADNCSCVICTSAIPGGRMRGGMDAKERRCPGMDGMPMLSGIFIGDAQDERADNYKLPPCSLPASQAS